MSWIVRLADEAKDEIATFPRDHQAMLYRGLKRMEENPFYGNLQLLKDKEWKGVYRRTIGRYRIFFTPLYDERIAQVVSIRLRNEKTYR
jgi:mRNA-degrading endonuclease RelE of RelBE toxin-antitoxin system